MYFSINPIIKESIDEILSISNKVLEWTDNIYNSFINEFKKEPFQRIDELVTSKNIIINGVIFGKETTILFKCYNVLDKNMYQIIQSIHKIGNAGVTKTGNIIINVGYLSGTLKTNIKMLLRHEIEHIYQQQQGETLHKHTSYKNSVNSYMKALTILKNGGAEYESEEWKVAYIIYTHSENEIDSFVNQLYQELSWDDFSDKDMVFNDSTCVINYSTGKEYLKEIQGNKEDYRQVIESFGFTIDGFLDLYEKMSRRYIRKIGKVITRYENENQPIEVCLNDLIQPKK